MKKEYKDLLKDENVLKRKDWSGMDDIKKRRR